MIFYLYGVTGKQPITERELKLLGKHDWSVKLVVKTSRRMGKTSNVSLANVIFILFPTAGICRKSSCGHQTAGPECSPSFHGSCNAEKGDEPIETASWIQRPSIRFSDEK